MSDVGRARADIALAGHRRWNRVAGRIGAVCVSLLILLLPAVLAARHLEVPATDAELARLERSFVADAAIAQDSEVARQFYRAAIASVDSWPVTATARQELVVRARLASVLAVLGLSLLLYLCVTVAHGRLQALVACGCLALLPPVSAAGHVLRPEAPAALLAGLALLLLQGLAPAQRPTRRRAASTIGFVSCAVLASGLAIATFPLAAAPLLVPGVVLTLGAVQLSLRSVRVVRRHGWAVLPVRALNRRLLPWTAAALLTPAVSLWLLSRLPEVTREGLTSTTEAAGYWPPTWLPFVGFVGLLGLGALAAIVRVGARWRRGGRIGPDLVLLTFCSVVLAGGLARAEGTDRLPLALATAAVLSDGVWAIAMLVQIRRRLKA